MTGPYRYRLSGTRALRHQDLAAAFAYIANSEYAVRWRSRLGAYACANRRQGMHFKFLPNGFVAEPLAGQGRAKPWKISLRLQAYGSRDPVDAGATSGSKANGHAIQIRTPQVIYDYNNDPAGMRQNFIIEKRPKTGHLRLELAAALEGVQMGVDKSANAAYFVDAATRRQVMRYADLNVWSDAMSPIAISLGVNAQQNAKFGFSVAGGDVSGDGYGDLMVGEPYRVNTQGGTHHEGSPYLLIRDQSGHFQSTGYGVGDAFNADSYLGWNVGFVPTLSGSLNGVGFLMGVPYPSDYGDVEAYWY